MTLPDATQPSPAPQVESPPPKARSNHAKAGMAALTLGALGVVFGDIGTSPLYAMKETFSGAHDLRPDEASVYGALSLVFWAITIIVSIKYVMFIMRADNGGEGGIMALISLVQNLSIRTTGGKLALVAIGVFGAALFYGDGMITPAISVARGLRSPPLRVPGTAVFLNADAACTPLAMRYNVEHNRVLHENVVVMSVETVGVPHVPAGERLTVDDLLIPDDGIVLVKARFGFQDVPDVPAALRQARAHGLEVDVEGASYFLSRVTIAVTSSPVMARWRKRLFTAMSRNAAGRAPYFNLPADRVVSFGSQIEV